MISFILFYFFGLPRQFDDGIKVFYDLLKLICLLEMDNQFRLQDYFLSTWLLFALLSFDFSTINRCLECFGLNPGDHAVFVFGKDLGHIAHDWKRIIINCVQLNLFKLILQQVFDFSN